jgi:outer membrane biosynthesis protein TonB
MGSKELVAMVRSCLLLLLSSILAACATQAPQATARDRSTRPVDLQNGSASSMGARYDRDGGRCTRGAVQLLTKEQYLGLREGWATAEHCTTAKKIETPATAGYPVRFAELKRSGSAQVVIRLEADGSVESVHAICATDTAFADAAAETARSIRYAPAECDGSPVRSIFLLPLDYDWK